MTVYLLKAFWEDDCGYTSTDLFVSYDEVMKEKDECFKSGAAEIRIEVYEVYEDCVCKRQDAFFGYNPYSLEEIEDFS